MEFAGRFLYAFVFIAGLGTTGVFCALRPKMTGVVDDASDVTWAHAVNSRDALEKALAGPIDFLEADISLGQVVGNEQPVPIPIMAHPPETTSDISLETWLDTVVTKRPEKSIKLDFKSVDAVEPALIVLQKYSSKLNSSVWLNADVLPGPINSTAIPVLVGKFLTLCRQYFPNAALSTGWTTSWFPTFDEDQWHYGWQHVREMADVIQCRRYESVDHPSFTFPVRGVFASRSIRQLQWLLNTVADSTLTVWSGKYDPLKTEDLLEIRASFPKDKVFYDVPEYISTPFLEKKGTVDVPSQDSIAGGGQWMIFTRGGTESCSAWTYARHSGVIVFGKSLTTSVLQKKVISLGEGDSLRITGRIKFFDTKDIETSEGGEEKLATAEEGSQELAIVLADISLFAKNATADSRGDPDLTIGDTDVIWSAMNSSTIYTFRHEYGQEHSSCRFFMLDSSRDRSFEAWTVPCDEDGSPEGVPRNGIPEVSSRKRLVMPTGPFLLGFVSSGEEHVAVYDLKLETRGELLASGSERPLHTTLRMVVSVVALLLYSLCFLF